MPLPPIETSPTLVVRFTAKASDRLVHLCRQRWRACGLIILEQQQQQRQRHQGNNNNGCEIVMTMTTTQDALQAQAERLRLVKRTADTAVMEYFTQAQARTTFRQDTNTTTTNNNNNNAAANHSQHILDSDGLFTAQERAFLTVRIWKQVTVLPDGVAKTELSELLESTYQASTTHVPWQVDHRPSVDVNVASSSSSSSSQRHREVLEQHGTQSDTLWHVLVQFGLLDVHMAIHQPALRGLVIAQTTLAPFWQLQAPVTLLHDYFGDEVAFYFAWMNCLSTWYTFPGVLGCGVYAFRIYRGDDIDTDEYTPFYGLICFVWAVLFCRFWERHEKRYAYAWGTYSLTPYERTKFFEKRPEFHGTLRKSRITGEYEIHYSSTQRRLTYVVSALVTVVMLAVAFSVMILSLNLQGYINPKHNPERWHADNPHPFQFPALAVLAEEGNVLDAQTLRNFIPVVLHVLCISALNSMYRTIAKQLTRAENHETQVAYTNSLVAKRFLFEAFDCWVALFYLAFYERNVDRLRTELVGVFQIDTVRRLLLECILPMLWQSYQQGHFVLPQTWNSFTHRPATMQDILEDLEKDEYDQFDDYMEIVIQFGYVTLFASAYPLASCVAIFANWVEIRADAFKLARLCRRPDIHRAAGIGTWGHLMKSIVWLSALTNCLITGFTSDQLMHYFPSFYARTETGYTDMGHEKGWVAVFMIFGLEHVMIVLGLLIYAIIPAVPEDIEDELERRQFLRMKEHDEAVKLKAKKEE